MQETVDLSSSQFVLHEFLILLLSEYFGPIWLPKQLRKVDVLHFAVSASFSAVISFLRSLMPLLSSWRALWALAAEALTPLAVNFSFSAR